MKEFIKKINWPMAGIVVLALVGVVRIFGLGQPAFQTAVYGAAVYGTVAAVTEFVRWLKPSEPAPTPTPTPAPTPTPTPAPADASALWAEMKKAEAKLARAKKAGDPGKLKSAEAELKKAKSALNKALTP